jgi:uncharacterized Ntn-hydrolase superfamily protein
VGSAVPYAIEGVGAIATQATTNVIHGPNGLRLLQLGFDPTQVLTSTLALDAHPENRQVFILDATGRTAAHTGSKNQDWKGAVVQTNLIAGGNGVDGPQVIDAMVRVFNEFEHESLAERLICAIDAGEEAGGCIEPDHTAALLVVGVEDELKIYLRPVLSLRVDYSMEPTKQLRVIFESYKAWITARRTEQQSVRGY